MQIQFDKFTVNGEATELADFLYEYEKQLQADQVKTTVVASDATANEVVSPSEPQTEEQSNPTI